jgi:hypothetical protein
MERENMLRSLTCGGAADDLEEIVSEILQARYGPVHPEALTRLMKASSRALDIVQI